jgi:uncharacterized protein YbaA (DUF1428 family)
MAHCAAKRRRLEAVCENPPASNHICGGDCTMYINGFLVPVPADKKAEYQDMAEKYWEIAKDYGALSHVEAWEADVKDGKLTDFRRAVNLQPGEMVVFSWMTWKDRATADASHDRIMADPRMKQFGESMPFDGKRMIYGGFDPLVVRQA